MARVREFREYLEGKGRVSGQELGAWLKRSPCSIARAVRLIGADYIRNYRGIVLVGENITKLLDYYEALEVPEGYVSLMSIYNEEFDKDLLTRARFINYVEISERFKPMVIVINHVRYIPGNMVDELLDYIDLKVSGVIDYEVKEPKNLEQLKAEKPWITDVRCFDMDWWPIEPKEYEFKYCKPKQMGD